MINEMAGLLSLKWNNHSIAFLNTVSNIRKKEKFCDATIICHGRFYPVHKFVLSTCSEYFEEIFEKIDNKNPIIIIKDIDTKELESLLNYMYDGEVNVLQELLPGLIKSAEALKIRGLAVPDDEDKNYSKNASSCGNSRGKRFRTSSPVPLNKRSRNLRRSEEVIQSSNNKEHFVETSHDQDLLNINEKSESTSTSLEVTSKQNKNSNNTNCNYADPNEQGQFSKSQFSDVKLEPVEVEEQTVNYDSQEISFTDSINFKDENFSNNVNEDSLTGHQSIPQCSTWDDIEPPSDGDGLSGIDERTDEIAASMISPIDVLQNFADGSFHIGQQLFKCPSCPHESRFQSNMMRHARTHLNLHKHKVHKCPICSYTSYLKGNMRIHMRRHTGEKPFACLICTFKTSHKSNLKVHTLNCHGSLNQFEN